MKSVVGLVGIRRFHGVRKREVWNKRSWNMGDRSEVRQSVREVFDGLLSEEIRFSQADWQVPVCLKL